LESQSKNVEVMTGFLQAVQELAVKRAASALGQRGGRKSAESRARARNARRPAQSPSAPTCPLCQDINFRDVTVEMITAHRAHSSTGTQTYESSSETTGPESGDDQHSGNYSINGSSGFTH
jgi:hypothetical protein